MPEKATLDIASQPKKRELPPLPTFDGGGFLVDVDDRDMPYGAMEEDT